MHRLKHMLRDRQILEPHPAEIAQRHLCRQPRTDLVRHRPRQEHLPSVRRAHDPRGAVDRNPEAVVVASLDRARVQPAAHPQRHAAGRRRVEERLLQLQRRRERILCGSEHRMHAVARHLDDGPAPGLDRAPGERVVGG